MNENAEIGLRTLVLAERILTEEEYANFNSRFEAASLKLEGRDEAIDEVNASIEKEMTIIGSTAIEDMLQEEVADTIVSIKKAGIKVWVLTEDKIGTAINIGISCGLLDSEMTQFKIRSINKDELKDQLE